MEPELITQEKAQALEALGVIQFHGWGMLPKKMIHHLSLGFLNCKFGFLGCAYYIDCSDIPRRTRYTCKYYRLKVK